MRSSVHATLVVSALLACACGERDAEPPEPPVLGTGDVDPVLSRLLTFKPSWVSRTVSSHDPSGANGDGAFNGYAGAGPAADGYQVIFHEKGEGQITRIWMTTLFENEYKGLRIVLDGKTVYDGKPLDFFAGAGTAWKNPIVYTKLQSSGGLLSLVPFPYHKEALVLFSQKPSYYQITYREGAGAAAGPTAEELRSFLSEKWWPSVTATPVVWLRAAVGQTAPLEVASGPVTLSRFWLRIPPDRLHQLKIALGGNALVPASFFFGLPASAALVKDGGWAALHSALYHADKDQGLLATRLPLPLADGEKLRLLCTSGAPLAVDVGLELASAHTAGVRTLMEYREQKSPGAATTMPLFQGSGPLHLISMAQELTGGSNKDRSYLEGDEMVRADGLEHPQHLGTGTEDYYNGGWYFAHGMHSNPLSGLVSFFNDKEGTATLQESLYRHHLVDPMISRAGLSFGMEAGALGKYPGLTVRSLGLAFAFDRAPALAAPLVEVPLSAVQNSRVSRGPLQLTSRFDGENGLQPVTRQVRYHKDISRFSVKCPPGVQPAGLLLQRTFDAAVGGQEAAVRLEGRQAGLLFDGYANLVRRLAQDEVYLQLEAGDCQDGGVDLELDARSSAVDFSEVSYSVGFFASKP